MTRIVGLEDPAAGRAVGELPADDPFSPSPPLDVKRGSGGVKRLEGAGEVGSLSRHLLVRSMASSGDTPAPATPGDADRPYLLRQSRYLHDKWVFQYGSLPHDHPAYRDALKALKMARPHLNEGEVKLVVLPRMPEVNAMVAYDGTIYVSLELMKMIDFYEELAAVFGHELEHHESADIARAVPRNKERREKIVQILDGATLDLSDLATSWVKGVGISRLQEHRADVQGGMRKLNEAGINPVATKLLLEKLHRHRIRDDEAPRGDLTHGKTLDRILSAGAWTRFEDLENLDKELTPIPASNREEWLKEAHLHPAELFYEGTYFGDQEYEKGIIDSMSPEERSLRFIALVRHWSGFSVSPDKFTKQRLLAFFAERIDSNDIEPLLADKNDRPLMRFLYFSLNLGVSTRQGFSPTGRAWGGDTLFPAPTTRVLDSWKDLIHSPEDLAHFRSLIPRLADHPIPYAAGPTVGIMEDLVTLILEKEIYGSPRAGQLDLKALWKEVLEWIEALDAYAAKKGISPIDKKEFRRKAVNVLSYPKWTGLDFSLHEQFLDSLEKVTGYQQRAPYDPYTKEVNQFYELQSFVSHILEAEEISAKKTSKIGNFVKRLAAGKNAREIGLVIGEVNFLITCTEVREKPVTIIDTGETIEAGSLHRADHFLRLHLALSYKELLENHPAFTGLTPLQKKVLGHFMTDKLGVYASLPEWELYRWWLAYQEHWPEEVENQIIQLGISASDEELLWMYRLGTSENAGYGFYDRNWFEQLISHYTGRDRCRELLAGVLAYRLAKMRPVQRLEAIDQWESQGIPVRALLGKTKGDNGHLVVQMVRDLTQYESEKQLLPVLADLSDWTLDPYLVNRLRSYVLNQELNQAADFNERVAMTFDEESAGGDLEAKQNLIEDEMETQEEVEEVRRHIRLNTDYLFEEGAVEVGLASALAWKGVESEKALADLSLLLKTKKSDRDLKERVAADIELPTGWKIWKPKSRQAWLREELNRKDQRLDLLLGQGFAGRFFLAKMLLVDGRLIIRPEYRWQIFDLFLSEVVAQKAGEEGLGDQIQKTANALASVEEWESLFFSLAPSIAGHVALPPPVSTPWHEVPAVQKMIKGVTTISKIEAALNNLPKDGETHPWKYREYYNARAQEALRGWLAERGVLEKPEDKPISPIEFIVEVAQRSGSLSVRFLQLLGQFVEIPSEYVAKFNRLYDGMKGQSKLAAIAVVERKWPEMWKHVKRFGKRLGGGSLMSVYDVEMDDGRRLVFRVCNPNIKYHLKESRELFDATLDQMLKQGSIDSETHERLKIAVAMVDDWILDELDFTGFMENDRAFREAHHGYQPDGFGYSLYIPQSAFPEYGIPDNNRFQADEKIAGKNLTRWDELIADGHDMKQVFALIAQSYREQLKRGQLHGDVHIGNYRVTPDNRVAILDRTFYLKLKPEEQDVINNALSGQTDFQPIYEYFLQLIPQEKRNADTSAQLMVRLAEMGQFMAIGEFNKLNRSLIVLRQLGVVIPLHLSLILRNLHALNELAKKAGFMSLAEAYTYVPPAKAAPDPDLIGGNGGTSLKVVFPLAFSLFHGLQGEPAELPRLESHGYQIDHDAGAGFPRPQPDAIGGAKTAPLQDTVIVSLTEPFGAEIWTNENLAGLFTPSESAGGGRVEGLEQTAAEEPAVESTEAVEEISDDEVTEADESPPDPSYAYTPFPSYFVAPAPAFIPSAAVFARL